MAAAYKKQRAQAGVTAAAERKKRREMARAAAAATPRAPLAVQSSRYEKMEAIGAGAFGVVYRAQDRHTGEIVAMKCLNGDDFDDHRFDSIFGDEVSALEACRGLPSVVQLRDSCRRDPATGEAFIVMEFVGPALKDAMRDRNGVRRHAEQEVRRIARQLLVGAAGMHGVGLMHRDMKPDNVLLDARGDLKICDLGRSRAVADDPPYSNLVVARNYRAPELLLGSTDYDALIDTWAIGCIMAELLAGNLLFYGDTSMEHLSEVLNVLGTGDIKEWSRCPQRLPSGCGPTNFLRDLFPSNPELAMVIGRPSLSEAGFEVLSGLLRCNPEKRMTAARALKHRWFEEA
ncbi:putative cyclin-dependent kinase F-2 [Dichanthelium oligosanthes]|uniref:[RNA-polymerase]-subunit kinase n=1 Tax=Dichanthelium oligosanthes TaxID=888268 RepID=A0A1E5VQM8_9POAL|nr:putative cyclin-dependent kinase F-2 [Dichanthelium oligosanthes]